MTYEGASPEGSENRYRWRTAEGGLGLPAWIAIGLLIAVVVLGFGAWWTFGLGRGGPMDGGGMGSGGMGHMGDMEIEDAPRVRRCTASAPARGSCFSTPRLRTSRWPGC